MQSELGGIIPAIASPCDENDNFLPEAYAALVLRLYQQGVHGLYVCGVTGDGYKMRLSERKQALEVAVQISSDYSGTVIAHVGSQSNTRDAVKLAEHAADVGASAIASIPPAMCSHKQLLQYYTYIAKASSLPVLVYHIPLLTGKSSSLEEMIELLDIPGVVGLKLTDWNLFFMKRLLMARPGIRVFSGFDEFLVPGLMYGAHGGIGMWYNFFPTLYLSIYNAVLEDDISKALLCQYALLEFCDLAWTYGPTAIFEFLIRKKGWAQKVFREPGPHLDNAVKKKIEPEIDRLILKIENVISS